MADELSPLDYLLHRGEAYPATRSAFLNLEILDGPADWGRLREAMDRASRVVIRMRQKVVIPPLPTTPPRWVVDPDFDLDYHLRRVALPANHQARAFGMNFDLIAAQSGQLGREDVRARRLVQIHRRRPARRIGADQLSELFVKRQEIAERIPVAEGHHPECTSTCATIARIYGQKWRIQYKRRGSARDN
jgi:hypothetical protein